MSDDKFDIKDFRRALGQFPTGVTVITTVDDKGDLIGVTASSFNSVSIDPALVLWSVDKGAYSASLFENSEYFAVNVLGKDQVDLSNRFAGRGEDKFAGLDCKKGLGGCPLLESTAAQFQCKTWNVYDGGDHLIVVGEVLEYSHSGSISPLVFSQGSYAVSMQHPSSMRRVEDDPKSDGFLDNYLLYLLHAGFAAASSKLYPRFMSECGITPGEWRVFTLLSEAPCISEERLARMVMQPLNVFRQTAESMLAKGYVQAGSDGLSLTKEGLTLSEVLFSIAQEHESSVLSVLTEDAVISLKASLKAIGKG